MGWKVFRILLSSLFYNKIGAAHNSYACHALSFHNDRESIHLHHPFNRPSAFRMFMLPYDLRSEWTSMYVTGSWATRPETIPLLHVSAVGCHVGFLTITHVGFSPSGRLFTTSASSPSGRHYFCQLPHLLDAITPVRLPHLWTHYSRRIPRLLAITHVGFPTSWTPLFASASSPFSQCSCQIHLLDAITDCTACTMLPTVCHPSGCRPSGH